MIRFQGDNEAHIGYICWKCKKLCWLLKMVNLGIIMSEKFTTSFKSIFDTSSDAYVNTINCVGVMGAGITLEFKKRYPIMFEHYREQCLKHAIRPGDCYTYFDAEHQIYLLGFAVKDDWKHWSTLEWIESSIKSLKLAIFWKMI